MILCFEREGFNLEIKPLFEFTGAFFADKDFLFKRWLCGDNNTVKEVRLYLCYGIDTDDGLSIGAKERIGIKLGSKFVERDIQWMFLTTIGDGKACLVLRIEECNIFYQ